MTDTELLNFAEYLLDIGADFYGMRDKVYGHLPNGERVSDDTLRKVLTTLKTEEEESESIQIS